VLQVQGDLPGARARLEASLIMKFALYGKDAVHVSIATTLVNLGSVLSNSGCTFEGASRAAQGVKMFEANSAQSKNKRAIEAFRDLFKRLNKKEKPGPKDKCVCGSAARFKDCCFSYL